jgi:hypothetical protein
VIGTGIAKLRVAVTAHRLHRSWRKLHGLGGIAAASSGVAAATLARDGQRPGCATAQSAPDVMPSQLADTVNFNRVASASRLAGVTLGDYFPHHDSRSAL